MREKFKTYELEEIIAYTLRLFGEGTQVICEMALMAVGAGLIRAHEPAIGIAGTGREADTAVILNPTNSQIVLDMRILEILCKPRFCLGES